MAAQPRHVCFTPRSGHQAAGLAESAVWTAASWQEFSSRKQHWSVQPYVRPLDAVHMTAGHNALCGSGPCHKLASTMRWHEWVVPIAELTGSALRAVRPPNLHITPDARHDLVTPQARRVPCSARPWPSWPMPCLEFVCERDGGDFRHSRTSKAVSQGRCLVPWILA